MSKSESVSVARAPLAGLLTWLLPGLGHLYLGERTRGLICLFVVTMTFWAGVAIGGVSGTVNPQQRKLWFIAQLCTGGNTAGAYVLHRNTATPSADDPPNYRGPHLSAEVGVHYTGVAGLLNVLVILDAIACAELAGGTRRGRRHLAAGRGEGRAVP